MPKMLHLSIFGNISLLEVNFFGLIYKSSIFGGIFFFVPLDPCRILLLSFNPPH